MAELTKTNRQAAQEAKAWSEVVTAHPRAGGHAGRQHLGSRHAADTDRFCVGWALLRRGLARLTYRS